MIRLLARCLLVVSVVSLVAGFPAPAAPPVRAQSPCDGLVAPRLATGGAARVTSGYGLSLKNRAATGAAGASEVTLLSFGMVVTVVDGPTCNFGYVWWQVRLADGTTGYAAEGSASDYFLEPYAVGVSLFQRSADGGNIAHYFVKPDGTAGFQGVFTIAPVNTTPRQAWQQVEIDTLRQGFELVRATCPDRLAGTAFDGVADAEAALDLPLPPLDYDYYPSADGSRLVLVRHQHLLLPRCTTVIPERVGISTVSVLDSSGTETTLFPYPQHGTVPGSADRYKPGDPSPWRVTLEEVAWSPNNRYVAFVASYLAECSGQLCSRFHMYVANLETGQLYVLGEGRHVGWTNGGDSLNYFRLITENDRQVAHLYTLRADGANRQEVWLPGGAVYVSDGRAGLGFPWNEGGTRVMVGNAGLGEVMLLNVADRSFTPPVVIPDAMIPGNRLAVELIQGEAAYLWSTIRGEFVVQNARSGDWTALASDLAVTGIAPERVQAFATGDRALIQMVDGTAYVLDLLADTLTPVRFEG